jgi:hypothetical protein
MIPHLAEYGDKIINATDLAKIRGKGQFNPPGFNPMDEAKNWKNINLFSGKKQESSGIEEGRIQDYACKKMDNVQLFNQTAFKSGGNPLLQLYFSSMNIKYIQDRVKAEILKLRNQPINVDIDRLILENLMQETLTLAYQGKIPQIIANNNVCTMKNILSDLNRQVINRYIKHAISSIDMYKYYIEDISKLPSPMSIPQNTSIKGSNVLEQQIGFESVTETNREIRAYNNKNSYFN